MDIEPHTPRSIGAAIRMQRKDMGLTLRGLSDKCHVSVQYLSDIENDRTIPSIRMLQKIVELGFQHKLTIGWSEDGETSFPAKPEEVEMLYALRNGDLQRALLMFTAIIITQNEQNEP